MLLVTAALLAVGSTHTHGADVSTKNMSGSWPAEVLIGIIAGE